MMDVASAIKACVPFAHKKLFPGVELHPAHFDPRSPVALLDGLQPIPHSPAWATAWDGVTGVVVVLDMDSDVPRVSLDGSTAKKAVQQAKKHGFVLERTGEAVTTLRLWSGGGQLQIPNAPESARVEARKPAGCSRVLTPRQVDLLTRVVHASSAKDADRPALTHIHLTPWFVDATDTARAARAHMGFVPHSVSIPRAIFRGWPKKYPKLGVSWAMEGEFFFLQVGEELRFTRVLGEEERVDLSGLIPAKDHGYLALVDTHHMLRAAQQAHATSLTNVAELAFSHGSVEVRGLRDDASVASSEVLPAVGATQPCRVAVRAKLLLECLTVLVAASVPRANVFYSGALNPLRFEAEDYTELIWPLERQEFSDADDDESTGDDGADHS